MSLTPRLSPEQIAALKAIPVSETSPNRVKVAAVMANAPIGVIAEAAGMTIGQLSRIARGRVANVNLHTAQKLATFFGCAVDDLFPTLTEAA